MRTDPPPPPTPHHWDYLMSFSEILVSAHHSDPSDTANALLHSHEVVEHLMTTTLVTEILTERCVGWRGGGQYCMSSLVHGSVMDILM